MTGIDYADLIRRVYADDVALHHFEELWWATAPNIFSDRKRGAGKLRVSDSGACRLSLWADVHGKLDIPENIEMRDSRMEPGIVDGARTACLIAAGIRRWYWPLTCVLEQPTGTDIPGHADVIVMAEPDPVEVIECKQTFFSQPITAPEEQNKKGEDHRYWIYQACRYAMDVGAPSFVVLVHAPGVWQPPARRAFRYDTAAWSNETLLEYTRLAGALEDAPPIADPREAFRCRSCRYSQCEQNENPLRPVVDRIVDEVGVV